MTPRLLAQLAFVADHDAAALAHDYEWPPVAPTPEERAEAERLRDIAGECSRRATAAGFVGGSDAAFGVEP